MSAALSRVFTDEDVEAFALLSGDENPIHVDQTYAQASAFGKPIVHGMLTASLIATLLGTQVPGPGTILVGQMIKFLRPVYVGETVTASVHVDTVNQRKRLARVTTQVRTKRGLCLDGEAVVRLPAGIGGSA